MAGGKSKFKVRISSLMNKKSIHKVGNMSKELAIGQTGEFLNNSKSSLERDRKLENNVTRDQNNFIQAYRDNSSDISNINIKSLKKKPSQSKKNHFYMYKNVKIVEGRFKGICGKVVKTDTHDWLILDNKILQGLKVHSDQCRLINTSGQRIECDVQMIQAEIDQGQQKCVPTSHGSLPRIGNEDSGKVIVASLQKSRAKVSKAQYNLEQTSHGKLSKQVKDIDLRDKSKNDDQEITRRTRPRRAAAPRVSYRSDGEYLTGSFPTWEESAFLTKPTIKQAAGIKSSIVKKKNISGPSIGTSAKAKSNPLPHYKKNRKRSPPIIPFPSENRMKQMRNMMPPVVIDSHDNNAIPDVLRHLSPNFKINIFNRRSGKIMRGNEAVSVKDLPSVLVKHPEYEPMVPLSQTTMQKNQGATISSEYRELCQARTSLNTSASETVQPQSRVRGSAVEGKFVVVTKGSHVGMMGKVEACIPGGWYMVSDILNEDSLNLDVVVHSSKLEIIPDEKIDEIEPKSTFHIGGKNKETNVKNMQNISSSVHLPKLPSKFINLRLDSLKKEKSLLLAMISKRLTGEEPLTGKVGKNKINVSRKKKWNATKESICTSLTTIEKSCHEVSDDHIGQAAPGDSKKNDNMSENLDLKHLNITLDRLCEKIAQQQQFLQEQLLAETMLKRGSKFLHQTKK